ATEPRPVNGASRCRCVARRGMETAATPNAERADSLLGSEGHPSPLQRALLRSPGTSGRGVPVCGCRACAGLKCQGYGATPRSRG
ncbi:MAG: hypothetical protein K8R89_03260, partial [Anaerolineae bacterium]|nr:hypothetical protein [Anaerolineae bacterium]